MAEADLRMRPGCLADLRTIPHGLRRTFDWRGRATRTELALLYIIPAIIYPAVAFGIGSLFAEASSGWAQSVAALAIAIPMPSAIVRRLHDMGKPGLLVLPYLVLIVVALWDASLDVYNDHPASDLWYNNRQLELMFALAWLGSIIGLMLPPKEENNPYGPNPRPAEKTI